jgi:predicted ATPase/class 3 adenylate cyclase
VARKLPSGTVTFLFTDVEGSTRLLHELGADRYADALATHRRLLREAFARHGGVEVDTQGDAFFVAFPTAPGALAAAVEARDALTTGQIKVRIGLHTGTPLVTDDGYIGPDVHLGARIAAAGNGGQVLVSADTRRLVEGEFLDLGEHRLKDFAASVWIHQLGGDQFPPLRTLANTNLPRPASRFVGRERDVGEVAALLRGPDRFLTLTGSGGAGKTRLAIEAAAQLIGQLRSGIFWFEAASFREPGLVTEAIARGIGARGDLAAHIGEREILLVVDNLEQVVAVGTDLAALVERCPNLRLLATSRERLHVRGEREYRVQTLADADAVALFCARADLEPAPAIARLCRALDNLPLAIELAAARSSLLSPSQIMDRLGGRLDLLRGGRDADPRQATLRATIDWSYELLTDAERRLFARLAVFAGSAALEDTEAVADANLDTLGSLVDKSLVHRTDDRIRMLESLRDYAAERLAASGERTELRRRHAMHYRDLAERWRAVLESGAPEEGPVALLDRESDNLRAAVEFGLEGGDVDLVRRITAALPMYWTMRGRHREARAWLERALAMSDARDGTQRRLYSALGQIAYALGDHEAAVRATDKAGVLAAEPAGVGERLAHLREQAIAAVRRGDVAAAEAAFTERLQLALAAGNGVSASSCRLNMASIANATHRPDRAQWLLDENLPFVRARGQARCEAHTLVGMAQTAIVRGRPQEADETTLPAVRLAFAIGDAPLTAFCLETLAVAAADRGDLRAATILAGTEALREALEVPPDEEEVAMRAAAFELLGPDPAAYQAESAHGRALDLAGLVDLAEAIAAPRSALAAA